MATYADEVDDALPIDLDNLESWQIGQRMLDARLAGATEDAALGAELARGALPPGNLAAPVIDKLLPAGRADRRRTPRPCCRARPKRGRSTCG